MKYELSEVELIDLLQKLNKLDDDLAMCTDSERIGDLVNHLQIRLREIAWDQYRKKHCLE